MDDTRKVIEALSKTAQDLEVKSIVSSILDDVVCDIETAHAIEKEINHDRHVKVLLRRCEAAEAALIEYKAMEKEKEKERHELAEVFIKEMMALEERIERAGLYGASDELESSVGNDEGVLSVQTSEARQHSENQSHIEERGNELDDQDQGGNTEINEIAQAQSPQVGPEKSEEQADVELAPTTLNYLEGAAASAFLTNEPSANAEEVVPEAPPSPPSITVSTNAAMEPPVSVTALTPIRKTMKKKKEVKITLENMNSVILMSIFEYMDALDIVNMAQTNAKLYTKVNNIFGLGGAVILSPRNSTEESAEDVEQEAAVVIDDTAEEELDDEVTRNAMMSPDVIVNASSSIRSIDMDSTSSVTSEHRATIVSIPSKPNASVSGAGASPSKQILEPTKPTTVKLPQKKTKEESKVVAAASKPIPNTVPIPNMQPQPQPMPSKFLASAAPPAKPVAAVAPSTSTGGSSLRKRSTPGFQMSPAVAQSLASKLLPAELSAIIAMRDQLRKKEEELVKADEDVNDLTAQLEGTINVKEVLTSKVKELQRSLQSDRESSAKITRQTASDQEVIAFLDERVQELEHTVDKFERERSKANEAMAKVKGASERQVAVLNDMLTYEREQQADHEKEWKSTKKVLVKEVKHCRAQIMALEAERDGYREENEKLKEALLSLGAGNGMPRNTNGGGGVKDGTRSRSFDTIAS